MPFDSVPWARALLASAAATGLLWLVLYAIRRGHRSARDRFVAAAEARLERSRVGADPSLVQAFRLSDFARVASRVVGISLGLAATYLWLTFVLDQFSATRPWGQRLGRFLIDTLQVLGWDALSAVPGLFTVGIIFLGARFASRLVRILFEAVRQGRLDLVGLTGVKALVTERLIVSLLWLFALVVAYPYLPGSQSDAFKGLSVFIGLVISLGSTGIVNQVMSGTLLVFSDALSPGDYVRIGDVEGTVVAMRVLATTIRTTQNEEITIPNAVIISGTTINYSRNDAQGVYASTSVTIGYDTPWRQVEALLQAAAAATPGIRQTPAPQVLQTRLNDFYVEYTLRVCIDVPVERTPTLAALHGHIQDAFNEHGVQIMSPHYLGDPPQAKVVAQQDWYSPPARPEGGTR